MDLSKELEIYYNMVYAENITETKILNLLILIKEKSDKILNFASQYDYDKDHPFNGYRSSVLFVVKFLAAVHCTKLNSEFDGTVQEIKIVLTALNKTLDAVLNFHDNSQLVRNNFSKEVFVENSQNDSEENLIKVQNKIKKNFNVNNQDEFKENLVRNNNNDTKESFVKNCEEIFNLQMPIDRQSLIDALESLQDSHVPFIFNKYYDFFYKGTNLNNINQTMLSGFLQNFDPWSWFKTIRNSTFNGTSLFLNTMQSSLTDSRFGTPQLDLIKNWLPFLSSSKPYIFETITVRRQLEWLICPITFELKHNPMKFQVLNHRKKFINCKLIRNTVNSSGHLLLYIFSPDYFNKSVDILDSFLSDWSLKLPGCSILIPELTYDKNEKLLTPLQDCLDVYLWAIGQNDSSINKIELLNIRNYNSTKSNINENLNNKVNTHSRSSSISSLSSFFNNGNSCNNVSSNSNSNVVINNSSNNKSVLDGIPSHITISGDSSGGNIATSLLLILNDIRTKFNQKLKMPNALVLAYTPFNLRDYSPIMLTSRFNYSLSPIVALTTIKSNLPLPEIEDDFMPLKNKDLIDENKKSKSEKNLNKFSNEDINENKSKPFKEKRNILKKSRKRSNSMNFYLVDRLNNYKLSDFFQQFRYLNQSKDSIEENNVNDLTEKFDSLTDEDDNSSETEELNLSYLAKTLSHYLSPYYNPRYTNENYCESEEDFELEEPTNFNKNLNFEKSNKKENQKDLNFKSNIQRMNDSTLNQNSVNESIIQNAFTMFWLFFSGSAKKSEELEWNKEFVDKLFSNQRKEAFINLTSKPYISPAFYDNFESLKDVSIYLLNSTCDMFLDDNICMAKKWKGNVNIKILDELPHGFLMLRFLKEAKEGQSIFFKMVKEALELKKPLPKLLQ